MNTYNSNTNSNTSGKSVCKKEEHSWLLKVIKRNFLTA